MLASRSMVLGQTVRRTLTRNLSSAVPTAEREYKYFDNFEIKQDIAIVRLNGPGKMNVINKGLQEESEKIFNEKILPNKNIKGVVFISSKPDNFIAGADIDMIKEIPDKSQLKDLTLKGHSFFDKIKETKLPLVAAINGVALGGGLEWALYCDYRIATSSKKTNLGLPEVKLGLLPGMAGTYHLPKLVGYPNALDMILTGKNIKPDKAKKMGLVDLVVDPVSLEEVAIRQAVGLANGTVKKSKRKADLITKILEGTPLRSIMFNKAQEQVMKTTGGKYPAPLAIIDVLKQSFNLNKKQHLDLESTKFAELASTKESEALIGIFHGMSAVKKHDFGAPKKPVEKIAVLGAGLMGSGIAQVSIDQGKFKVFLKDKDQAGSSRGESVINADLKNKLKKKRITNHQYCETLSRLVPLHDGMESWKKHLSQSDLVIEAVFEELSVKHKVIQEMESIIPPHAIFATNTSAIPIAKIAEGAKNPERVIGMHYFSPVPKMPLLEIITHEKTAPEVAAAAMEVGAKQGKTPILVKDVPGFYVNRCLAPFMAEVTALVAEGVDLQRIDKAMKNFGMPVGPITLADEVGIDISNHVGTFMSKADLGDRMKGGDSSLMQTMVDNKWLGKKSGKGFYMYDNSKSKEKVLNPEMTAMLAQYHASKGVNPAEGNKISEEDIQMRLISKFVNEAAYCLQDGIIRSATDGDIGAVFGIGFPPFLGGPFRMLDIHGVRPFVERMLKYRDQYGPQFEPAQILKDYAKDNKKFHN